jgi:hypothetical protein
MTADATLWDLLEQHDQLRARWHHNRAEDDRLAMRAAWDIHITSPGSGPFGEHPKPGDWAKCAPPVLCHETGDEDNDQLPLDGLR